MAIDFTGVTGHTDQTGRLTLLFEKNTLPGTFLFSGPSGIGKKLIAQRTIAAVFCTSSNPPCLDCRDCRQIAENIHPDFVFLSPNERGIIPIGSEDKKEEGSVRWIIERLSMKSVSGKRAALIDGVDHMRVEGQNALLKTIEEPSPGSVLFLIASGTAGILPTIISRCFGIKFAPLSVREILDLLEKKMLINEHSPVIAEISGGSFENAVRISGGKLFLICVTSADASTHFIREKESGRLQRRNWKKRLERRDCLIYLSIYTGATSCICSSGRK